MAVAVHVRLDSPGAVGTALCFHRCYGSLLRRRFASHQGLHRQQIGWRQRGLVGSYADMNSRAAVRVRDSDHSDAIAMPVQAAAARQMPRIAKGGRFTVWRFRWVLPMSFSGP